MNGWMDQKPLIDLKAVTMIFQFHLWMNQSIFSISFVILLTSIVELYGKQLFWCWKCSCIGIIIKVGVNIITAGFMEVRKFVYPHLPNNICNIAKKIAYESDQTGTCYNAPFPLNNEHSLNNRRQQATTVYMPVLGTYAHTIKCLAPILCIIEVYSHG